NVITRAESYPPFLARVNRSAEVEVPGLRRALSLILRINVRRVKTYPQRPFNIKINVLRHHRSFGKTRWLGFVADRVIVGAGPFFTFPVFRVQVSAQIYTGIGKARQA